MNRGWTLLHIHRLGELRLALVSCRGRPSDRTFAPISALIESLFRVTFPMHDVAASLSGQVPGDVQRARAVPSDPLETASSCQRQTPWQ